MDHFLSLLRKLDRLNLGLCIFLMATMSLVVIAQVFARYMLGQAFVWAEELVRYLLIWMVLLGAALVQAGEQHIRIDFIPQLVRPRIRLVLETFFRLGVLFFVVIITAKGFQAARFNGLLESSGLRISMFWPSLALPVGAVLIGLNTLRFLIRDVAALVRPQGRQPAGED